MDLTVAGSTGRAGPAVLLWTLQPPDHAEHQNHAWQPGVLVGRPVAFRRDVTG
jgi:hypothetical protein